jgi:hypothetical protein
MSPELGEMSIDQLARAISDHLSLPHERESHSWHAQIGRLLSEKIRRQGAAMQEKQRQARRALVQPPAQAAAVVSTSTAGRSAS